VVTGRSPFLGPFRLAPVFEIGFSHLFCLSILQFAVPIADGDRPSIIFSFRLLLRMVTICLRLIFLPQPLRRASRALRVLSISSTRVFSLVNTVLYSAANTLFGSPSRAYRARAWSFSAHRNRPTGGFLVYLFLPVL
jgi:hypothetical protein